MDKKMEDDAHSHAATDNTDKACHWKNGECSKVSTPPPPPPPPSSSSSTSSFVPMTKLEKGRWKKLSRRATYHEEERSNNNDESDNDNDNANGDKGNSKTENKTFSKKRKMARSASKEASTRKTGITVRRDYMEFLQLLDKKKQQQQQQESPPKKKNNGEEKEETSEPHDPSKLSLENLSPSAEGPRLFLRGPKQQEEENQRGVRKCDASDVRNMILSLLFHDESEAPPAKKQQQQQPAKRKRSDNDNHVKRQEIPLVPNFCHIHNPAAMESLLVVEFQVNLKTRQTNKTASSSEGQDDSWQVMPFYRQSQASRAKQAHDNEAKDKAFQTTTATGQDEHQQQPPTSLEQLFLPQGLSRRSVTAALQVHLFDAPPPPAAATEPGKSSLLPATTVTHPKSMTDVLLYFPPRQCQDLEKALWPPPKPVTTTHADTDGETKRQTWATQLDQLLLTPRHFKKEGYPLAIGESKRRGKSEAAKDGRKHSKRKRKRSQPLPESPQPKTSQLATTLSPEDEASFRIMSAASSSTFTPMEANDITAWERVEQTPQPQTCSKGKEHAPPPPSLDDRKKAQEQIRKSFLTLGAEGISLQTGPFALSEATALVTNLAVPVQRNERFQKDLRKEGKSASSAKKEEQPKEETEKEDDQHVQEVFVQTFPKTDNAQQENRSSTIFALDCEMVQTSTGPELARVTLLQWKTPTLEKTKERSEEEDLPLPEDYEVVFDWLVKPRRPILDYLTAYSGIRPDMLQDVSRRIEQVQVALLGLIGSEDVLVGHSLENDLWALRLVHERVIDTAIVFRTGGRKFALRHLSGALLQKQIQSSQAGHCSVEDAATALVLVLRRLDRGPSFAMKESNGKRNLFDFVGQIRRLYGRNDSSLFVTREAGTDDKRHPLVSIGTMEWINRHITGGNQNGAHALTCESVQSPTALAAGSWLRSENRAAGVVWAHLAVEEEAADEANRRIDIYLDFLMKQIPPTTAVLLLFQRDLRRASDLTRRRKALKDPRATLQWSDDQEEDWIRAMNASSTCEALWL